jgi:hypothetical protein
LGPVACTARAYASSVQRSRAQVAIAVQIKAMSAFSRASAGREGSA